MQNDWPWPRLQLAQPRSQDLDDVEIQHGTERELEQLIISEEPEHVVVKNNVGYRYTCLNPGKDKM